jgi:hypothetical protein
MELNLSLDLLRTVVQENEKYNSNAVQIESINDEDNSSDLWEGEEIPIDGTVELNTFEKELQRFKLEPRVPKNKCILEFWNNHRLSYPILSSIAMDYLSIPAGSVCSERANSAAKVTFDGRDNLGDTTFCAEMCVRSWIKLFKAISSYFV